MGFIRPAAGLVCTGLRLCLAHSQTYISRARVEPALDREAAAVRGAVSLHGQRPAQGFPRGSQRCNCKIMTHRTSVVSTAADPKASCRWCFCPACAQMGFLCALALCCMFRPLLASDVLLLEPRTSSGLDTGSGSDLDRILTLGTNPGHQWLRRPGLREYGTSRPRHEIFHTADQKDWTQPNSLWRCCRDRRTAKCLTKR